VKDHELQNCVDNHAQLALKRKAEGPCCPSPCRVSQPPLAEKVRKKKAKKEARISPQPSM